MVKSTSNFPEFYERLLKQILAGFLEEAQGELTRISSRSTLSIEDKLLLSLLKIRLSFLSGGAQPVSLEVPTAASPLLQAEVSFVLGLNSFHLGDFLKGRDHFLRASHRFKSARSENKALLSDYNVLIADVNIDLHYSPQLQLSRLNLILEEALRIKDFHMQSIIFRQRGLVFKEISRLVAAFEDVSRSYELCLAANNVSDIQSCLLHMADVELDLGLLEKAQAHFEMILPPFDHRNVFPYRYLEARLTGSKSISVEGLSYICAHFKQRALTFGISLEGLSDLSKLTRSEKTLYHILMAGPATREDLVTRLWPNERCTESHFNRLYQLVSRLNKKVSVGIRKKNHVYSFEASAVCEETNSMRPTGNNAPQTNLGVSTRL